MSTGEDTISATQQADAVIQRTISDHSHQTGERPDSRSVGGLDRQRDLLRAVDFADGFQRVRANRSRGRKSALTAKSQHCYSSVLFCYPITSPAKITGRKDAFVQNRARGAIRAKRASKLAILYAARAARYSAREHRGFTPSHRKHRQSRYARCRFWAIRTGYFSTCYTRNFARRWGIFPVTAIKIGPRGCRGKILLGFAKDIPQIPPVQCSKGQNRPYDA